MKNEKNKKCKPQNLMASIYSVVSLAHDNLDTQKVSGLRKKSNIKIQLITLLKSLYFLWMWVTA